MKWRGAADPGLMLGGVRGVARLHRRDEPVGVRLRRGDVVVLDRTDLDSATAEAMLSAEVAAVVNASASATGRAPAGGALLLLRAGVPVLDSVGVAAVARVKEGQTVVLRGDALTDTGGREIARGRTLRDADVAAAMGHARDVLIARAEAVAVGAADLLRREPELLLRGEGLPRWLPELQRSTVAVVAPGPTLTADLKALRWLLADNSVKAVAAGDAAPLARRAGIRLEAVVDDADGLRAAPPLPYERAVMLVGPHQSSAAPELPFPHDVVATSLPAEDVALLLAHHGGAELIVSLGGRSGGAHSDDELLSRPGAAADVLLRLQTGSHLVGAAALLRLAPPSHWARSPAWVHAVAVAAALLLLLAVVGWAAAPDLAPNATATTNGWSQLISRVTTGWRILLRMAG